MLVRALWSQLRRGYLLRWMGREIMILMGGDNNLSYNSQHIKHILIATLSLKNVYLYNSLFQLKGLTWVSLSLMTPRMNSHLLRGY